MHLHCSSSFGKIGGTNGNSECNDAAGIFSSSSSSSSFSVSDRAACICSNRSSLLISANATTLPAY